MVFFSWIRSLFTSKAKTEYIECNSCGRVLTSNFFSSDTTICDVCVREVEEAVQPKEEFPKVGEHEPEVVEPMEDFSAFDDKVLTKETIKECSHCHKGLPATTEFFHKRSSTKDGLQYICKTCITEIKRIKRAKKSKARSHKGS